MRNKYFI